MSEREWQCLAKTTRAAYEAVEAAIREAHSYEEPEIVATEIVAGSPGYLAWIEENVTRSAGGSRG
jgi:periplasmic divalent cation tolerance protein